MATKLKEKHVIERRGKRWAIVRVTKVGRSIEIRVTIATKARRLDATIWLAEQGLS